MWCMAHIRVYYLGCIGIKWKPAFDSRRSIPGVRTGSRIQYVFFLLYSMLIRETWLFKPTKPSHRTGHRKCTSTYLKFRLKLEPGFDSRRPKTTPWYFCFVVPFVCALFCLATSALSREIGRDREEKQPQFKPKGRILPYKPRCRTWCTSTLLGVRRFTSSGTPGVRIVRSKKRAFFLGGFPCTRPNLLNRFRLAPRKEKARQEPRKKVDARGSPASNSFILCE
ncbi:hypothetical protein C8F04DRAFT_101429 [Mycena alexandri]|uniref:Uncharacterized protein n=1 Tax=Mycena alexandri TaxID=1745969 RepID=A0AAD6SIT0_9AGAR|nr:hypothetical protein C8F04DRAFT_101429 [Mycena alexandri]